MTYRFIIFVPYKGSYMIKVSTVNPVCLTPCLVREVGLGVVLCEIFICILTILAYPRVERSVSRRVAIPSCGRLPCVAVLSHGCMNMPHPAARQSRFPTKTMKQMLS